MNNLSAGFKCRRSIETSTLSKLLATFDSPRDKHGRYVPLISPHRQSVIDQTTVLQNV